MQCILPTKSSDNPLHGPLLARNLDWSSSNWPSLVEPQAYAKCTLRFVTNPSFFRDPNRVLPLFGVHFQEILNGSNGRNVRMKKFLLFPYFFLCGIQLLTFLHVQDAKGRNAKRKNFVFIFEDLADPGPLVSSRFQLPLIPLEKRLANDRKRFAYTFWARTEEPGQNVTHWRIRSENFSGKGRGNLKPF